jgi:hypothetical protein
MSWVRFKVAATREIETGWRRGAERSAWGGCDLGGSVARSIFLQKGLEVWGGCDGGILAQDFGTQDFGTQDVYACLR